MVSKMDGLSQYVSRYQQRAAVTKLSVDRCKHSTESRTHHNAERRLSEQRRTPQAKSWLMRLRSVGMDKDRPGLVTPFHSLEGDTCHCV